MVMDSLPFGGDEVDTLPLAPKELDLLATSFDEEEPDMPEAPPTVPSQRLSLFEDCRNPLLKESVFPVLVV